MMIPASENSVIGMFDELYVDIGDEQSIEQSLSTFSSHMTNIARILRTADEKSLIMLDELCSGTEPQLKAQRLRYLSLMNSENVTAR